VSDQSSETKQILIVDDSTDEENEQFRVGLMGSTWSRIGSQDMATVTILDND